jgi:DNA-binding MarR family transcriptional regulator
MEPWYPNCWTSNKLTDAQRSGTRPASAEAAAPSRARKRAALGILPSLLGYWLRLAQRAVFDDFQRSIGEPDLSPGLFGLLVIIEANPGLKQSDLADAAMLDRSTMVPALDKLESRGLVARRPPPEDRRVNGLWLTADGAALLRRLKRRVLAHEQRLTGGLSGQERDQLFDLLGRLAEKEPPA